MASEVDAPVETFALDWDRWGIWSEETASRLAPGQTSPILLIGALWSSM